MKSFNHFRNIFSILGSGFILLHCSPSQEIVETTTIYLQEIDVNGPLNQSPIHLTDKSETPSITFTPGFSYNTTKSVQGKIAGHTMVNEDGIFQVDTIFNSDGSINHYEEAPAANRYQYTKNNLNWFLPSVKAGLDIDFKITKNFGLFGGINYSTSSNKNLWGGNFGLGLYGAGESGMAFRLDVGAHIQSISYDAYTVEKVVITGAYSSEYVLFYHDIDENSNFNPFINLTINSCKTDWLFNFFLNFGYSTQTLADFEPKQLDEKYYEDWLFYPDNIYREITYDLRGESTLGLFHFTPGLTFALGENYNLLVGSRFYFITSLNDAATTTFIMPMMQVDFNL